MISICKFVAEVEEFKIEDESKELIAQELMPLASRSTFALEIVNNSSILLSIVNNSSTLLSIVNNSSILLSIVLVPGVAPFLVIEQFI